MARIKVNDFTQIGLLGGWDSTNWAVYLADSNGNPIYNMKLFESLNDKVNKNEIVATLRNPDGTLFDTTLEDHATVAVISFNKAGVQQPQYITQYCGKLQIM